MKRDSGYVWKLRYNGPGTDEQWQGVLDDLTLDLAGVEPGEYVELYYACATDVVDPTPYARAGLRACGQWYCAVVAETELPTTVWAMDEAALRHLGFRRRPAPHDTRWFTTARTARDAAHAVIAGLRDGRLCDDPTGFVSTDGIGRALQPPDQW